MRCESFIHYYPKKFWFKGKEKKETQLMTKKLVFKGTSFLQEKGSLLAKVAGC